MRSTLYSLTCASFDTGDIGNIGLRALDLPPRLLGTYATHTMFSGIVSGALPITTLTRLEGLTTLGIQFPSEMLVGLEVGASVAIDGVCLTVTGLEDDVALFDVMMQTLALTNLGQLEVGSPVNTERSLIQGAEVGGHIISGHVDGTATVESIEQPENNFVLNLTLPVEWMRYVFPKGYLALNGTSLTVAHSNKATGQITIYLIPETLRATSFSSKRVGDRINFEVDRNTQVIVDTVTNFLEGLLERKELGADEIRALQEGPRVRADD